jgi:uncharacterized protein (TIGR00725 family)
MPNKTTFVAVIGGGTCTREKARLAEEVGRELARKGAVLICGGLGGVMKAACKGAFSAGGTTIGILPGNNRQAANPYVSIPIVTGLGAARNVIVVKSAHAVIAVHGSYGTLSEIGHALKNGIPVVGLNTWSLSQEGRTDDAVIPARSAAEAVALALDLATQPEAEDE